MGSIGTGPEVSEEVVDVIEHYNYIRSVAVFHRFITQKLVDDFLVATEDVYDPETLDEMYQQLWDQLRVKSRELLDR